ncbi:SMI1/KNR4 family protein [Phocoenobacter skyensis]|uniref:SMI1/KNR4 family protein n=1 Tax=Phocoenobacter skyensis TaxID=97481 RepID=A0A1H7YD34_9PAST|nr:SMI1/KNR4 family protein [Pasteurella skyensis]MDP8079715.1 SMI1/KNR4 family protein [Pasteurella skyensis]MDP8085710.1 SMI1/KNR4 family protein [Pasteurella skyensis]MDP8185479.1 SMI1/KNR4 family protein [Pasteurella skyensis]QLB22311.1 hypothetical protein A6B44_03485 [Pasteurella skyensis]SEM43873.1 hypothetical protein SAMN05444853_1184 [Pasteurella skyensis]
MTNKWQNLSQSYHIYSIKIDLSEQDILLLKNHCPIILPVDYIELLSENAEIEIGVAEKYLRFWNAAGCIEMNEAYKIQHYLPKAWAIADDGGGGVLLYIKTDEELNLYFCRLEDLDMAEATKISTSISDLLFYDIGLKTLLTKI